MLEIISKRHSHHINNFYMVGDTVHDFKASKNNKIEFIFVEYGYGQINLDSVNSIKNISQLKNYL